MIGPASGSFAPIGTAPNGACFTDGRASAFGLRARNARTDERVTRTATLYSWHTYGAIDIGPPICLRYLAGTIFALTGQSAGPLQVKCLTKYR